MRHYQIAFVGMGSIGKRHLKNVCDYIVSNGESYTIDLFRSSQSKELPEEVISQVSNQYSVEAPIINNYDIVFVTNPTSLHKWTIEKFKEHTRSFFIEKPVFDVIPEVDYDIIGIISYVACPLRYNSVLQYIKNQIDLKKVISVRAISSSYLPDWRPNQDYRTTYCAHKEMGGGVDIDLIHEWDYLTWIFGMPVECRRIAGKFSNLEIDSNDTAIYIARNEHMVFELHLDYYGRQKRRELDILTTDDTIHCDIINGRISFFNESETICFDNERNRCHMEQIKHFFDIINGKCSNDSSIPHAIKVLKLTKSII